MNIVRGQDGDLRLLRRTGGKRQGRHTARQHRNKSSPAIGHRQLHVALKDAKLTSLPREEKALTKYIR